MSSLERRREFPRRPNPPRRSRGTHSGFAAVLLAFFSGMLATCTVVLAVRAAMGYDLWIGLMPTGSIALLALALALKIAEPFVGRDQ